MTLRRVVLALLLIVAAVLFVVGYQAGTTNDPVTTANGAIEAFLPGQGSPNVPRQTQIGLDLAPGWKAAGLIVAGVTIPEDQLNCFEDCFSGPGQSAAGDVGNPRTDTLFFVPGAGKAIETLPPGKQCASAHVWRVTETETQARPLTWCFAVV